MESTLVVHPKGEHPAIHVWNILVILRKLLEMFPTHQLLELSLVNKQWNFEARSVMRDRSNLIASIRNTCFDSCQNIVEFAADMDKMRIVPMSGIRLLLYHCFLDDFCQSSTITTGSQNSPHNQILERLPCKSLAVTFKANWEKYKDCQAFLLVKNALENFAGVLEDLSFDFDFENIKLFQQVVQCKKFPRLQILTLSIQNPTDDFTYFVKVLVSCAPNLKELRMQRDISFKENVLEGSLAVLVPYIRFNPLYEVFCESLVGALRPRRIEICRPGERNFDEELLRRHIPMVLQASVPTLNSFKMDLLFALPLMCYGISLVNVTELDIQVDGCLLERFPPRLLIMLKRFDFTRVFPKLNQVEILSDCSHSFSPDQISLFVEQGNNNGVLRETLPDRVINIKRLILDNTILGSAVRFSARMFPHVNSVSVFLTRKSLTDVFTFLWDDFKWLTELEVAHEGYCLEMENLDSVFCGIFPEEVAELRKKDDEYLKAVNIVPVMPSIAYMRDLRTFTFRFFSEPFMPPGRGSSFMFSKVTGSIGFARCPDLLVTVQTCSGQCAEALSHMKPYASFTSVD